MGSVVMLDLSQSLIFSRPFDAVDPTMAGAHTVDGLWWRRDAGIGGYVSVANVTGGPLEASLQAIGAQGTAQAPLTLPLPAHATQMLDLDQLVESLPGVENQSGGVRVQYTGPMGGIIVTGGLVNAQEGYSANMPFWPDDTNTSAPMAITYASAGLMTGAPDPMMAFPSGTQFEPYLTLRNTTASVLTVSPALNWMGSAGAPVARSLPPITLGPFQSEQADMKALLQSVGLSGFNGNLNLSLAFTGHAGDLILATGSVDNTGTYVFEVEPEGVGPSRSKQVAYWTVAGGFDTMFSLWNPTNQPQDLLMTFYYSDGSGSYALPVHLDGNASTMIDLMMLVESQQADANGQTFSVTETAGSAIIRSAAGTKTPVTLVVAGSVYNVQTATCNLACITCCGYAGFAVNPGNFYCPVGTGLQCNLQGTDCNGYTATFSANWSSSDTTIMTVDSTGYATGVAPGSATISAQASSLITVYQGQVCSGSGQPACPTAQPSLSTTGSTTPQVSISGPAYVPLVKAGSTGPNSMNLTATGTPSGGTYSWTTSSSKVSLTNTTSATVTVTSVAASASAGDVPITVTYSLNGESGTNTANITVSQPTSLSLTVDTTNATGHTCVGGSGTNTCGQSYFSGSGTYTSYLRNRQYHIMDQLNPPRWIAGYDMQIQESYTAPSGQCSGDTIATGGGFGDTVTDCFYFCSAGCQTGVSCSVSSTQTITVNGFTVATESVNWTCSGATVSP